jgi:hypothetical protein
VGSVATCLQNINISWQNVAEIYITIGSLPCKEDYTDGWENNESRVHCRTEIRYETLYFTEGGGGWGWWWRYAWFAFGRNVNSRKFT